MSERIVVTGGTGSIGSRALSLLAERGANVTALVRDETKTNGLPAGVRAVKGSFEDPESLFAAFDGAHTVVAITPASARGYVQAFAMFEAARATGVKKIVRVSALKADVDGPTDNTRQHGRTEAALRESGLGYVILRPHLFMQNLLGSLGSILGEGKLYQGSGDGKMGMIDTRDVSDAVVAAVTSSEFDGTTLELTGPASIDHHTVAAAIGRGLGRDVTYVPVPPEAAGEAMRAFGADDWTVGVVRDYSIAYSWDWGDFTTNEVERLTGHPARSIDDFVREVLVPVVKSRG